MSAARVAALFVRRDTPYASLGCDCFDVRRDALTWRGGMPGVFHPPCRAWSQLSHFAKPRPGERQLAVWAMQMVRRWGGVVEHPYNSRLWRESSCLSFGVRDQWGGLLVPAFQSWWGHRAPKRSCFYVVGAVPVMPDDSHLKPLTTVERLSAASREATPPELAKWLVNLAARCVVTA